MKEIVKQIDELEIVRPDASAATRYYPYACVPESLLQQIKAALTDRQWVPVEPTEEMLDAPRQIILYAETAGRTWEGLRNHLTACGESMDYFGNAERVAIGHLTKSAIAFLIYKAMLAAAKEPE